MSVTQFKEYKNPTTLPFELDGIQRQEEVRSLLQLTEDQIRQKAGRTMEVYDGLDSLYAALAIRIADTIEANNKANRDSRFILPVGPTEQYQLLLNIIEERKLSLQRCHFFFMDEYEGTNGKAVPATHPLSFKGIMKRIFFDKLNAEELTPPKEIIFPNETNIHELSEKMADDGGLDVCFGGTGIHGHLAFNEPETDVSKLGARRVHLNDFTVTINAARSGVGGNLACFPRWAYTVGLADILKAKEIVLVCRHEPAFDWSQTILRLALFGKPGDDYPVTHIRGKKFIILTTNDSLKKPNTIL